MEFIGTLVKRLFRRLYTLPGRSAIDALASWMSSAPVGVLITVRQYVSGHYTGREAALLVANIEAEITRFVIGVISVTQLIYMSEVGILMIKCEILLRFSHLLTIFLLRTLICLPIVMVFARFVVYDRE